MAYQLEGKNPAHKRNKAKIQVNNFLIEDSDSKVDDLKYVEDLNMINILPELLQNDSEKKIICDYDDLSPIEYSDHSV